jgi:hypothetical protein
MSGDTGRCGTYAGYQAHIKGTPKTEPCSPCRDAARRYANERRKRVEVRRREMELDNARMRALSRLAAMHPSEYAALYEEETWDLVAPPRKKREEAS